MAAAIDADDDADADVAKSSTVAGADKLLAASKFRSAWLQFLHPSNTMVTKLANDQEFQGSYPSSLFAS